MGVLYKDDWHRAVVIETTRTPLHSTQVKVKFLDLGIERRVEAYSNMRVVDEKFFNVPLKALKCSLYVDEDITKVVIQTGASVYENQRLCLSREARKFFVKVIYQKGFSFCSFRVRVFAKM